MHEAQEHKDNAFITLTYNDENLPNYKEGRYPTLRYRDFQKFLKRLRKRYGAGIRFYMCGEYGEQYGRPHYHAALFGLDFPDKTYWRKSESGFPSYRSEQLASLWPHGNSECGDLTFESAAYMARYIMKKRLGKEAANYYTRVDPITLAEYSIEPEFNNMSRRPGIGRGWFEKWNKDVYPHDFVVIDGQQHKPPRYYDNLLKVLAPQNFEDIKKRRLENAFKNKADNTPARLAVKETVAMARLKLKKRTLE